MNNSKKFLKLFFSIGVATTTIVTTSYTAVSCGHKSSGGQPTAPTWDDYKEIGLKATAADIGMNASVNNPNWDTSKASNFAFTKHGGIIPFESTKSLFTAVVYLPKWETAEFEATYVKGHKYVDSDWKWEGKNDLKIMP